MNTMLLSRSAGFVHLLATSALLFGALAGCSPEGAEEPVALGSLLPEGTGTVAEFEVRLRPSAHQVEVLRSARTDRRDPGLSLQSQIELPIVQNDIPGSGPQNTVELVTNSAGIDADCPAPFKSQSFCGNVTLRHFFASQGFNNVYIQVTDILDLFQQPLAGHGGLNSDPKALGLDNTLGLWRYTAAGFPGASGILGKSVAGSTNNEGTRDWIFANPDNADTLIRLRVVASPTYERYTRSTFTTTAFLDACALPGASRSVLTSPISQTLPFPFTLFGGGNASSFGTTSLNVNYNFKGVITLGSTGLPGGSNENLPSPIAGVPRPAIFAFWDDLAYSGNGAVCSASTGTAPARIFVITWNDMKFATDAANTTSLTFSAYLQEGTDKVEIVYKKMTSSNDQRRASGSSATVGLQDATGTVATAGSGNGATNTAADGSTFRSYTFTPNP